MRSRRKLVEALNNIDEVVMESPMAYAILQHDFGCVDLLLQFNASVFMPFAFIKQNDKDEDVIDFKYSMDDKKLAATFFSK